MHTLPKLLPLLGLVLACGAHANPWCDQLAAQAVYATPGTPIPLRTIAPRAPMLRLWHSGLFDFIHTANQDTCNDAIDVRGYVPDGVAGYVDRSPKANTGVFYGFWKDAPQTDHFYTTFGNEIDYVLANGWVPLSAANEIDLLSSQVGDSLPLYRTHFFSHATAESAHHYGTSWSVVQQLQASGWIFDSVAGYVHRHGTPKPSSSGDSRTVPMGRRCEYLSIATTQRCFPLGAVPSNYRDFQFNQYALMGNAAEPPNRSKQGMSFSFTHQGYFTNNLHLAGALRAETVINTSNITQSSLHGLGIAIGPFGPVDGLRRCPVDGINIAVEAFWATGNNVQPQGCTYTGPLQAGATYNVTLLVDDAGTVEYTLTGPGLNIYKSTPAASYFPKAYPFWPMKGGHMLIDSGDTAGVDYDITIANYRTWWQ